MNSKNLLLIVAGVLIVLGLFKPDFFKFINNPNPDNTVSVVVEKPTNAEILDECQSVIDALKSDSDRKTDGLRLASLYNDMATLVSLDDEDMVLKNTEEIRQANRLAGAMLRMDIKGKYPKLAESLKDVLVASIGDDSVLLDTKLRQQASEAFKALAWACAEGTK